MWYTIQRYNSQKYMTYQDENSPFFQGGAGPVDPMGNAPEEGVAQNAPAVDMQLGDDQQQLVQPDQSVTLGEVRDNVASTEVTNEVEPPTLESAESNVNDAFNKRFGTSGALDLGSDNVPAEPLQQSGLGAEAVTPVEQSAPPAAAVRSEPIQQPVAAQAPAAPLQASQVAPQTPPVPEPVPEEVPQANTPEPPAEPVTEAAPLAPPSSPPTLEPEVPPVSPALADEGSVEDRMARLKNMAANAEPPAPAPPASEAEDSAAQKGGNANNVPDL